MKTIGEVWEENNQLLGLKVRWSDWGHRYSYFEIKGIDNKTQKVHGSLNTGEEISYSLSSKNWKTYQLGDELSARAV